MWRSRQRVGCALGTAALAILSVSPVGCAAQPRKQAPEAAEADKGPGLLAGASWSVISDSRRLAERQQVMVVGQHAAADQQARPSPVWLDLHGGRSRAVNREPDLGRYEF